MTRGLVHGAWIAVLGLVVLLGPACNKPSEGDCKKAVANILRLYGNDSEGGISPQAMTRSCRGNATAESVQCFINAKSLADLDECEKKGGFSSAPAEQPAAPAGEQPAAPAGEQPAAPAEQPAAPAAGAAADTPAGQGGPAAQPPEPSAQQ